MNAAFLEEPRAHPSLAMRQTTKQCICPAFALAMQLPPEMPSKVSVEGAHFKRYAQHHVLVWR